MARPQRNNVDYFPFLCKEGDAMKYIESKYGNDGFATWIKLLRQLAIKNFHHLNLGKDRSVKILASTCKVTDTVLINIIEDLVEFEEFDKELWNEHKTLFNPKFIESIQDAYKKRSNDCITRDQVLGMIKGTFKPVDNNQQSGKTSAERKTSYQERKHDLFPGLKPTIQQLFDDLQNSSDLEQISKVTGYSVDQLKHKLIDKDGFRKAADLHYDNKFKFQTHFKNWILKQKEKEKDQPKLKINRIG